MDTNFERKKQAYNINLINDYSKINIIPNSLVVFDIDETVIKFPELGKDWWKNKLAHYYAIYNDYDKADISALEDWIEHVKINKPQMINKDSFIEFFDSALDNNCKIIFLTARNVKLRDLTYQHLIHLDIINHNKIHDIYFNENKGEELKKILQKEEYSEIKEIIFIDDLEENLKDIYNNLSKEYKLNLYHFNYLI